MTSVVSRSGYAKGKQQKNDGKPTGDHSKGIVVFQPAAEIMSRQQLPYCVGISELQPAQKTFSMNLIIIPQLAAEPHLHKGCETAIYVLSGPADTRCGRKLKNSIICQEGELRVTAYCRLIRFCS
jgi:uncharacterized RmlC-like cupin family protein